MFSYVEHSIDHWERLLNKLDIEFHVNEYVYVDINSMIEYKLSNRSFKKNNYSKNVFFFFAKLTSHV